MQRNSPQFGEVEELVSAKRVRLRRGRSGGSSSLLPSRWCRPERHQHDVIAAHGQLQLQLTLRADSNQAICFPGTLLS